MTLLDIIYAIIAGFGIVGGALLGMYAFVRVHENDEKDSI